MKFKSAVYKALSLSNDYNAGYQAVKKRSVRPIVMRIARKSALRGAGSFINKLFR